MASKVYKTLLEGFEEIAKETNNEKLLKEVKQNKKQKRRTREKPIVYKGSGNLNVYKFFNRRKIGDYLIKRRYARKRAKKGYCYYDLSDIDVWFLRILVDMLKEFRLRFQGYPTDVLIEEYKSNKDLYPYLDEDDIYVFPYEDQQKKDELNLLEDNAEQRWKNIIGEMITEFETVSRMLDDGYEANKKYEDYYVEMHLHLGNAFALLQKWFFALWV